MSSKNAFDGKIYNLSRHISSKLEIVTTQLPVAIVGMEYSKIKVNPVVVSGSEGTSKYRFSLAETGDRLPGSLVLNGNGTITGIPLPGDIGKYNLVVRVEDDMGNAVNKPLELSVANMSIVTADLPVARLEMNYATQFEGFSFLGGKAPFTFEVQKGILPDGLHLESDGRISGIPGKTGESNFTLIVMDSNGNRVEKDFILKVENVINVTLSPASPKTDAQSGNNMSIKISASRSGFNDIYEYRLVDAPDWLVLNSDYFGTTVSGIPAEPGTFNFKILVKVAGSSIIQSVPYTIVAKENQAASALTISTDQLDNGAVNAPWSQTISVTGGKGIKTFEFTEDSDRPKGLTLSQDGTLTWMPAGQDYGYYTIGIKVMDQENHAITKSFRLYVKGGLLVDPPDQAELKATIGKEFSRSLSARGGTVESYNYTLSPKGDKLPAGLTFRNGLISGKPEPGSAGNYNIIIRVSENGGSFSGSEVKYRLVVSE